MYQSSGRLLWVIFVLLLSELGKLLLLCTLMQRICWNLMICLQSFVCGNIAICMVQVSTATSAMELVSFLCYCESYVIENVFIQNCKICLHKHGYLLVMVMKAVNLFICIFVGVFCLFVFQKSAYFTVLRVRSLNN